MDLEEGLRGGGGGWKRCGLRNDGTSRGGGNDRGINKILYAWI